jgi:hypothetical protein
MGLTGDVAGRGAEENPQHMSRDHGTDVDLRGQYPKMINSVVLVRKRTIPTERQQPVGEVSANFS